MPEPNLITDAPRRGRKKSSDILRQMTLARSTGLHPAVPPRESNIFERITEAAPAWHSAQEAWGNAITGAQALMNIAGHGAQQAWQGIEDFMREDAAKLGNFMGNIGEGYDRYTDWVRESLPPWLRMFTHPNFNAWGGEYLGGNQ